MSTNKQSPAFDAKFKTRWIKTTRVFCNVCGWKGERMDRGNHEYGDCPKCPRGELRANGVPIHRIREMRGMPFLERGMRVEVAGKMGTIVAGNDSANLNVRIDGRGNRPDNCHPWWDIRYFDQEGNVIRDYTFANQWHCTEHDRESTDCGCPRPVVTVD